MGAASSYSTPEMIAIERNPLTVSQRESRRRWTDADPKFVDQKSRKFGLSEEQTAAAHAATDKKALAIVEGAAGSGKTTTLRVVVDCYREAGKRVLGGATAWRTVQMLQHELGIDAYAIDSLLARIEAGQPVLDQNTVLLIDECGQIGSRGMNRLLTAAAKAKAKTILVGDREQLQPISAGASLKILTSVIAPTRIDKIVRQRAEWAQAAATAFAKGDAATGLAAYAENGLLESCIGAKATITAAVDRYMQAKQAAPVLTHLLIAKSNKVVRALNAKIRKRMRADNILAGPDYMIKAGDSSGRAFTLSLAIGDHIRFGLRQDNIGDGVINGTVGRIEKIDELDGKHLLIEAIIDQKRVSFSTEALQDQAGRVRLGHNLAVTAYSSQGLTAETATVVLESGFDRHDSYVAMSRSRGNTSILYDAELVSAKMNAAQELGTKRNEITGENRLAFLAQSISRANLKTSTLAFEEPDHADSQNARRVSRNLHDRSLE
jgi:ATP-dependent exoDNAse (exonuclease V) alpha subunit